MFSYNYLLCCLTFITSIITINTSIAQPVSTPVKILGHDKKTYVINRNSIDIIHDKHTLRSVIYPLAAVNDATIKKQELWLATDKGAYIYDLKSYELKDQYFDRQKITAVATDVHNKVWIGTFLNGVYKQNDKDSFEQKLNVTATYTLLCTPDSNAYIGTNIGLYKMNIANDQITRFAEEGHSGHELPDNIVEQLFKDDHSNIWVIMPENISFKSSKYYNGEIPSYAFVGDKSNRIINIIGLKKDKAYLIVTEKSLALLPANSIEKDHHHVHSDEIFGKQNTPAFYVESDKLNTPKFLMNEPITYVAKVNKVIYFFTERGHWKIPEKNLLKQFNL